jgi:hypothetical protein
VFEYGNNYSSKKLYRTELWCKQIMQKGIWSLAQNGFSPQRLFVKIHLHGRFHTPTSHNAVFHTAKVRKRLENEAANASILENRTMQQSRTLKSDV